MTVVAPAAGPALVRRPAGALARIEGRRLLLHPVVLAGVAVAIAFAATFARAAEQGGAYLVVIGAGLVPVGLGVFVAANLATLRSGRSGAGELLDSLAAPPEVPTWAHLGSAVFGSLAGVVLVAAFLVAFGGWDGLPVTDVRGEAVPNAVQLAQGPLAVLALGVLGVALARWIPYLPVAPVAAVGLLGLQLIATTWNLQHPLAWLAPVVNPARARGDTWWPCDHADVLCAVDSFADASLAWHLVYLAGLSLVLGAVALLRHGWSPRIGLAGGIGLAVAAAAGVLQLP